MILITLRSLREFSGTPVLTANPGTGRRLAAERYDELIESHPEAFADHAAEFWLAAGADPDKAVRLARMNLDVRDTPRARSLLARAVAANTANLRHESHKEMV
jgi:hypothetical protein